jgi:hypothetical protein
MITIKVVFTFAGNGGGKSLLLTGQPTLKEKKYHGGEKVLRGSSKQFSQSPRSRQSWAIVSSLSKDPCQKVLDCFVKIGEEQIRWNSRSIKPSMREIGLRRNFKKIPKGERYVANNRKQDTKQSKIP